MLGVRAGPDWSGAGADWVFFAVEAAVVGATPPTPCCLRCILCTESLRAPELILCTAVDAGCAVGFGAWALGETRGRSLEHIDNHGTVFRNLR